MRTQHKITNESSLGMEKNMWSQQRSVRDVDAAIGVDIVRTMIMPRSTKAAAEIVNMTIGLNIDEGAGVTLRSSSVQMSLMAERYHHKTGHRSHMGHHRRTALHKCLHLRAQMDLRRKIERKTPEINAEDPKTNLRGTQT